MVGRHVAKAGLAEGAVELGRLEGLGRREDFEEGTEEEGHAEDDSLG